MRPVSFSEYLANINSVDGWLSNTTAVISHELMKYQSDRGIRGNVCEIGVHHGRYFIALAVGLQRGELGVAIDLFDAQDENIDKSGLGSRPDFERNLSRFLDPACVCIIAGNSVRLSCDKITSHGLVRFFSVDGGHTEAITLNDLKLAEGTLSPGGIVAIDDIFRMDWSGVTGGVASYRHGTGGLVGFAVTPNKLFLCGAERVAEYRAFLSKTFSAACSKGDAELFGWPVDIYHELPPEIIGRWLPKSESGIFEENARLKLELESLLNSRRYRAGTLLATAYNGILGLGKRGHK